MSDASPSNPPPLSERERIQALLDAGRISQADAELLFNALDDEEAPEESFGVGEAAEGLSDTGTGTVGESAAAQGFVSTNGSPTDPLRDTSEENARERVTENASGSSANGLADDVARELSPQPPEPPEPPTPVIPLPPPPPEATWGAAESGRAPQEDAFKEAAGREETGVEHWLKLAGGCGDLLVTVDPTLREPTFTGEGVLERQGSNYVFRTPFDWKSTTVDFAKAMTEGFMSSRASDGKGGNWLTKLRSLGSSLKICLPEGYGLDLGLFAGDGTIRGVRALRGKFTGGDLTVEGAEHLDLNVTSGDVTMKVRPVRGEQRLRATSGDVTLTFLAGSDVTVSGKATAGDIDVPRGFSQGRGFGTTELSGVLGAGRARLELRLTAGDVDIRAEDI